MPRAQVLRPVEVPHLPFFATFSFFFFFFLFAITGLDWGTFPTYSFRMDLINVGFDWNTSTMIPRNHLHQ